MNRTALRRCLVISIGVIALIMIPFLASCTTGQTGPTFLDSGTNNLIATGQQFAQYNFFRFDTAAAGRTMTLPNAVDLSSALGSPSAGTFLVFIVTSDGANPVTITGNTDVTVKPSAATIPANKTQTLCAVFSILGSGGQAVTIY
jgi:hypothetical protein